MGWGAFWSNKFALAHVCLVLTNIAFGGGAVVGKAGLKAGCPPVIFALYRESIAGPVLCALAYLIERHSVRLGDAWRFLLTGSCLFANQLFFMLGLNLGTATYAAIWQPSQPIFAAAIAMAFCMERPLAGKILGILVATGSAVLMLACKDGDESHAKSYLLSTLCLVGNCVGMALYVLTMKPLLRRYPPLTVTGLNYIVASVEMAFASLYYVHDSSAYHIAGKAWLALAYWITLSSVMAYFFITFANQYVDGSVVCFYTTLQPVSAAVLSFIFLHEVPPLTDLGAVGIVAGMVLVIYTDWRARRAAASAGEDEADADGTDGGKGGGGGGSGSGGDARVEGKALLRDAASERGAGARALVAPHPGEPLLAPGGGRLGYGYSKLGGAGPGDESDGDDASGGCKESAAGVGVDGSARVCEDAAGADGSARV